MPLAVRGCAVCKWAFSSLQLALRAYHGLKSTCKASSLWKATRTVLYIGQWLRNSKASLTKAKALFNMPPVQQLTSAGQSPPGLLKPTLQCTPGHDFHQIAPTNSTRSRPSTAPYPADFLSSGWLPPLWSQLSKPPALLPHSQYMHQDAEKLLCSGSPWFPCAAYRSSADCWVRRWAARCSAPRP